MQIFSQEHSDFNLKVGISLIKVGITGVVVLCRESEAIYAETSKELRAVDYK